MAFPQPPAILSQRDLNLAELDQNPSAAQLRIYAWMQLARATDNRILELFRQGLIRGTVTGGQGNEGLSIPVALFADKANDVICFTHRDLGGHLIWGRHLCDHLNQYFANADSHTKAREGNIHHGDPENRSYPMISHLGAMLSTVIGATDSQRRLGKAAVGFASFGDGGSSTGDIHESLNLVSLLRVPVVFLIQNNGYAYSTPVGEQFNSVELWKRAAGYGIEGMVIDTADVPEAAKKLGEAIEKARSTSQPVLVEAKVQRLRGHAAYDTCDYLLPGELEALQARDPLLLFRKSLVAAGRQTELDAIDNELSTYIEACIKVSLAVARPQPTGMEVDLYAPSKEPLPWKNTPASAEPMNMAQALNRALRKILDERPESILLGQDIATYGGAFKVTEGLYKDFGRSRVFNTPLAESACTGYAIGLALNGHRPIEEFQFADFSTEAVTQITQNAATFHFRAGAAVPLVLRLPCGGGLTFGSFHSQELEALFLSMPGLKALYPSTPQDAFNALLAAYEDNNPVLLFEHKGLYRRGKQPVVWDPNYREAWQPRHVVKGDFATVVTYGEMVHLAVEACEYLRGEYEKSFDMFDLRCLSPLKLDAIRESVARTHRLIVLHEGRRNHGFGAEIVSRIAEELFFSLESPPLRIASLDLPVPFAPELERAYRPTKESIIEKIVAWMG